MPEFELRPAGPRDLLFTPHLGSEGCLEWSLSCHKGGHGASVNEVRGWRGWPCLGVRPCPTRTEAFFWLWVAEGSPAGGGLGSQKLASWALPCRAPTKPERQTCVMSMPLTPSRDGRGGWPPKPLSAHSPLSPKPQGPPRLPGLLGVHTHIHTQNHTPPHTDSESHAHTNAHTARMTSCWPGNPLDSSVLMVPGGGEGGLGGQLAHGGDAEKSGPALEVGDHGGRGDKSTVTLPQAAREERGHIHSPVKQPPTHPRKVC